MGSNNGGENGFVKFQKPTSLTRQIFFLLSLALCASTRVSAQNASFAVTQRPTAISTNSATLNAMVLPNGLLTVAWFEWGTNSNYGNRTATSSLGMGTSVVRTSATISGLVQQQIVHCRVVASNMFGAVMGADQMFIAGGKVRGWGYSGAGETNIPSGLLAVQVAAGDSDVIALRSDGTVLPWGSNGYGQTSVPTSVTNALEVAAGGIHNLALLSDHTVAAWGSNSYGQTNVPPGLTNVVGIASIAYHNAALCGDGTMVAWGRNLNGETNIPVGLSNVVAVSVGFYHTMALKADGTVLAWGGNYNGQTNVPAGLTNVVAIAAGRHHSLALLKDGTVVGWGLNAQGEATAPAGLSNVVAIAGGHEHSIALKSDGTVVAWGYNVYGQSTVPADVAQAAAIGSGYLNSFAIAKNIAPQAASQTYSGAMNADLIIGLPGYDPNGDAITLRIASTPGLGALYQYANGIRGAQITTPNTLVSDAFRRVIFAPTTLTCGDPYTSFTWYASELVATSTVATATIQIPCSPYATTQPAGPITATNAFLNGMATGNGLTSSVWFQWSTNSSFLDRATAPMQIPASMAVQRVSGTVSNLTRAQSVYYRLVVSNTAGVTFGGECTLTTGGKIWSWGDNSSGQTNFPTNLGRAVGVAGGMNHSLALYNDGTVRAWGSNTGGQTNVPAGLSNVVAIAGEQSQSLALKSNGTVVLWGSAANGESNFVASLTDAISIAAGQSHALALRSNGTVVAWGNNAFGQTNVPAGLSNVVWIAAGNDHSVALRNDGRVWVWGKNNFGQTNVPTIRGKVTSVAAGATHSIAVVDQSGTDSNDPEVVIWGNNNSGQTNVPSSVYSIVSIGGGTNHCSAANLYGEVISWGGNTLGQTNTPALSNIVAVATGANHTLALENAPPWALSQKVIGSANQDLVIQFNAYDPNGLPISFTITTLPASGTLYQYSAGQRGTAITTANTVVSDANGRVIFVPAANAVGDPYTTFRFIAITDGARSIPGPPQLTVVIVGRPYALTTPATGITESSATVNGIVTPNSFASTAWFDWGTTTNYSQRTASINVSNGSGVVPVSLLLSNFTAAQVIHFRVGASNSMGTNVGLDQIFITGGRVSAWGAGLGNNVGQTNVPVGLTNAVAIAAGYNHTLAQRTDGSLLAWGSNAYGQTDIPPNLANVIAIAANGYFNLALKGNGSVTAWGRNDYNQTNVPAQATNVIAIACGSFHALALRTDGTVVAWGRNDVGQTNVPSGLTNVVGIAAGQFHSVAVRHDGTVIAWGSSSNNVLNVPSTATNVASVKCGYYHTVAVRKDGATICWGSTNSVVSTVPANVTNTLAIAAGGNASLAIKSDRTFTSWGDSTYNQRSIPTGLNKGVALAMGAFHTVALLENLPPSAKNGTINGFPNVDTVVVLSGTDLNNDPLTFRLKTLASSGTLYEYAGAGTRGAILSTNTMIDSSGRIIFAPDANQTGSPYAGFSYVANDGILDSGSGAILVNIVLPSAPQISSLVSMSNTGFELLFNGQSNAAYRVWTSTNLADWQLQSSALEIAPGVYRFQDGASTNVARQFYRVSAP